MLPRDGDARLQGAKGHVGELSILLVVGFSHGLPSWSPVLGTEEVMVCTRTWQNSSVQCCGQETALPEVLPEEPAFLSWGFLLKRVELKI